MEKNKKNKQTKIILLVIFLVLCVAASTVIFMDRIREFLPGDEGAISLINEEEKGGTGDENIGGSQQPSSETAEKTEADKSDEVDETEDGTTEVTGPVYRPGFEVSDGNGKWTKESTMEIFTISHSEDGAQISVKSDNGEKVIAPGTTNSYTFKLKNTGDVALDYSLFIEAFTSQNGIHIPVEVRVNRHDSEWIAGDSDTWESVPELNGTNDNYTVGAGRYTTYTLEWRWPFESGDDEWDTYLGNLTIDEDVSLTMKISTIAEISTNPNATGGILPKTGDSSNVTMYILLMGGAILCMFLILWKRECEEDAEDLYE